MEQEACMICSNPLSEEEKLFRPCDCSLQYCFYCFKDLFEKLSGSRSGRCPQCQVHLKARIQVPCSPSAQLPSDKSKLREVRIISRESLYIKHLPVTLSLETLRSPCYFGKYGKITHLSIDLKYFPEDPPETYRLFLHYSSKIPAAKALIAIQGLVLNNNQVHGEYLVLNFCGNFLRGKKCPVSSCKFLHQIPEKPDWFWFRDLGKIDLTFPKDVEKVEKVKSEPLPEVDIVFKVKQEIVLPKRSSKYAPKYIPVNAIHFKKTGADEIPLAKAASFQEMKGKNVKGGAFSLLAEED